MLVMTGVRAGYGAAQLFWPGLGVDRLLRRRLDGNGALVARVLGGRHLAQAVACASSPTAAVLALGTEVDVLHAASMVGLAVVNRSYRLPALVSAAVATGFASAGWAATVRARRNWPVAHPSSVLVRTRDYAADVLAPLLVPRWHVRNRKERA